MPGSSPNIIAVSRNTIYFTANDGEHGYEFWKTDGTKEGTVMIKHIYPGKFSSTWSNTCAAQVIDGTLYFSAIDETHGYELWKTDGTECISSNWDPITSLSSPKRSSSSDGKINTRVEFALQWRDYYVEYALVSIVEPGETFVRKWLLSRIFHLHESCPGLYLSKKLERDTNGRS